MMQSSDAVTLVVVVTATIMKLSRKHWMQLSQRQLVAITLAAGDMTNVDEFDVDCGRKHRNQAHHLCPLLDALDLSVHSCHVTFLFLCHVTFELIMSAVFCTASTFELHTVVHTYRVSPCNAHLAGC
eukprot:scaffold140520_cov17-Tisochrysis_lutea.AAC.3